jgi:Zn-dependent protease/CBS domain-containing protein
VFRVGSSIQLARIFGIRIGASPSWFIVLFLGIILLSNYFRDVLVDSSDTTAYLVAVLAAVCFFGSLILHELGHALEARRSGIRIEGIELWFFGGLAKLSRDTRSPGEEFRVSVAGPVVTLIIVGLCLLAGLVASRLGDVLDTAVFSDEQTTPALALLGWLGTINAFLLVFNLVPAFPLDGGRIARAIAWKITGDRAKGTRFSGRLGQGFAYLLIGFGIFLLATGATLDGVYAMLLGWFLLQAATGAVASARFSDHLGGVTAGDLMDAQPVTLPAGATLLQTQDEYFDRYRWDFFPVVDIDGRFLGLLHAGQVSAALTAGRPTLTAADLLDHDAAATASVPDDTPLEDLFGDARLREHGSVMVVDAQRRLRGVVTVDQVRRAIAAAAGPGKG